jgi:hypothetical protein
MGAYPYASPQVTPSTRSRPVETDRASRTGKPCRNVAGDRPTPEGFVWQARPRHPPRRISARLGQPRVRQLRPGDLADSHPPRVLGSGTRRLLGSGLPTGGERGLEGLDPLRVLRALRQGPRGRRGPRQVRPGQLVCDAEVHATLLGSRRAVDSGDCTVAMAIPTPPIVWRHAPGCACAPDGTRPPAADPDTAGGDRIACDCDVLGLAGHPVQGPLAGAPRPAPLLARPPPGDLCCTDVQPGIGLQAPVLRRSTSARVPVLGRQQCALTSPGQHTDVLADVPHERDSRGQRDAGLPCGRLFAPIAGGCHRQAGSLCVY